MPKKGWSKCNNDGAINYSTLHKTACGRLLRDESGTWICVWLIIWGCIRFSWLNFGASLLLFNFLGIKSSTLFFLRQIWWWRIHSWIKGTLLLTLVLLLFSSSIALGWRIDKFKFFTLYANKLECWLDYELCALSTYDPHLLDPPPFCCVNHL